MRLIASILLFLMTAAASAAEMQSLNLNSLHEKIRAHSGKTMVVFWAPWCPHCVREIITLRNNPLFAEENNLQLIGLTYVRDKRSAERFVSKEKINYDMFLAEKDIFDEYQKIDAVPLTIVFENDLTVWDFEYGKQDVEELELMLLD